MPRWKTTEQILNLSKDGEVFDENWMNYNSIFEYMPDPTRWKENRLITFKDVQIWEVIVEISGPIGVYAAWQPYSPYFVIMERWSIHQEFWGIDGEKELYKYISKYNIKLPINKIWVDPEDMWLYEKPEQKNLIIP